VKPITIDSEAELELAGSVEFYELRLIGLGLELEAAARLAVRAIQVAPGRYPMGSGRTRRFVMDRFPFVIHYMDLPDRVWIIAFAHTSRQPNYWKRRLR
jgi:toxin ParE1/3/4